MYPTVCFLYFFSAAVILLASLTLMFQFSLPYNNAERASVFYSFILVWCVCYGMQQKCHLFHNLCVVSL